MNVSRVWVDRLSKGCILRARDSNLKPVTSGLIFFFGNLGLLKLYVCISMQVLIHAAYAICGVGYSIQMMNNWLRTLTFCLPAVCHDHSLLRSVSVSDAINFQQNSIFYKLSVIDYPLRSLIHRESPGSSLSRTWAQWWMQPPGHQ